MIFKYKAIDGNSSFTEIDEADSINTICRKLVKRKSYLISYKSINKKFLKLKVNDLIMLLEHIKCQRSESFSVIKALESFINVSDNIVLIFFLKNALKHLKSGETISSAFQDIFDEALIGFFITLENTGDFELVVNSMIEYIKLRSTIKYSILSKMKYPIFVFLATSCVLFGFSEFLLPTISGVFEQSNQIETLICCYKIITFSLMLYILVCIFSDKFVVQNPLTGPFVIRLNNWYFSMVLCINLKSKILLAKAIDNAVSSINNIYIRNEFSNITKKIQSGYSISESIRTTKFISKGLLEFLSIGEVSNKFLEMLNAYNNIEKMYISEKIKNASLIASYGIILGSGVMLIFLIIGFFIPLYSQLFNIDYSL